ncbi:hypothetical protein D6C92_10298 [Aureobasidium pullulans]|nr:hypothetical protein D6C92_10298 [Aureobasidium pullulans]
MTFILAKLSVAATLLLTSILQPTSANPLPQQSLEKRGCYGGFPFNHLHGGYHHDLTSEVLSDITSTCLAAAGKTISSSSPFWRCTNWQETNSWKETCFSDCEDGCAALPKDYGAALCGLGCDPNCDTGPTYGYNRIDWAIEMRDGGADKVIDFETCVNAFKTELGGCQSGSEQYHDGFWFRIDPAQGGC